MRKSLVLTLALLALVASLTWLLSSGEPSATGPSERSPAEAAPSPEDDVPPAAARRRRRPRTPATETAAEPGESTQPTPPQPPANDPWVVVVLGPDGVPATGIPVRIVKGADDPDGSSVWRLTDANGRAELGHHGAQSLVVDTPGLSGEPMELTERTTILRLPGLLPLEFLVVDGETGRQVPGAQIVITGRGRRRVVPSHGPTGASLDASPARGGEHLQMTGLVEPPRGFARQTSAFRVLATISRFARSVRVPIVLRPEVTVRVRVLEQDGTPAAGAEVAFVLVGVKPPPYRAGTADGDGEIDVGGIPFLRGESVRIGVRKGDRTAATPPIALTSLTSLRAMETVELTLPAVRDSIGESIGIGGGAGGAFGRRGGRTRIQVGTGRIEALVYRRNGRLAAGALVVLDGRGPFGGRTLPRKARTDEAGLALFERLPAGNYTLCVREPGYVPVSHSLDLAQGESTAVTLQEPAGRYATVRVVDAEGVGVPYASITVEPGGGLPYIALDGDVQQIGLFTDERGFCELRGLPGGDVKVTARFGSRSAEGSIEALASITLTLGAGL